MNDVEYQLTGDQTQTVLGTLLGTGSIILPKAGKNAYLQMRQKKSGDVNWLRCKAGELADVARPHPFVEDKDSWHWASVANPVWNKFLALCYQDGTKTVTMDWLDPLRDRGHAVWFLDKGLYDEKTRQVVLKTAWFGEKGTSLIQKYFDLCGYECEVQVNRSVWKLVFSQRGSEEYLKLILPCFPKYLLDQAVLPNPSNTRRSG